MDARWFVPLLASLLLGLLAGELNHLLAPAGVSVVLAGLVLPLPALKLSFRPGLATVLVAGLLFDAVAPGPFGLRAALLALAFVTVHATRHRIARDATQSHILVAIAANLALFFAPLLPGAGGELAAATLGRALADLVASQVLVALAVPWFVALQEQALRWCGVDLAEEKRARS